MLTPERRLQRCSTPCTPRSPLSHAPTGVAPLPIHSPHFTKSCNAAPCMKPQCRATSARLTQRLEFLGSVFRNFPTHLPHPHSPWGSRHSHSYGRSHSQNRGAAANAATDRPQPPHKTREVSLRALLVASVGAAGRGGGKKVTQAPQAGGCARFRGTRDLGRTWLRGFTGRPSGRACRTACVRHR